MFILSQFIIAKKWNWPNCPSTECYLVIKTNEVLICGTGWMNFEDIMLNQRSRTQGATHCMILFIWNIGRSKSIDKKIDWWLLGLGVRGVEEWRVTAHGYVVSFWGDEIIKIRLRWWLHSEYTKNHEVVQFMWSQKSLKSCHLQLGWTQRLLCWVE